MPTSFPNNSLSELILFKVDEFRTIDIDKKTFLFKFLEGQGLVFWFDLTLPGVDVEMNVQPCVLSLVLFDGEFSPQPPVLEGGLITILHTLEPSRGGLLDFWILVSVGVHLDIDLEEVLDGVLPEFLLIAVFLKPGSDKTKLEWSVRPRLIQLDGANHLCTPVPKIVH